MGRAVQRTVQQIFWALVTCAAFLWLALPATLAKHIFGSP